MSTSLPLQRSERLLPQTEANDQPQNSLLPRFPPEITHEILRSVLVCPEHLSFTRLPLSAKERVARGPPKNRSGWNWQAQFSKVLRLCIWGKCQNDEPDAAALHANFSSLCLVSKEIRYEARDIFFSKNKWVLHCTSSYDAIQWVLNHWGQDALCRMTDLRLEVQAHQYYMVPFYESLTKFVDAVKEKHSLQSLSVEWIASGGALQCARPSGNNWSPHVVLVDRDYGLERNSEGGRGRENWEEEDGSPWDGPDSEELDWAEREIILHPLQSLRGARQVRIEGTVTEAWAEYLEMAMSALRDAEIPEFELQERAKEGLERLEHGIEVKYGA